jgi:Tol biopolymer transport system component
VLVNLSDGKSYGITQPTVGMPGDALPALATTGRRLAFVRARALGVEDLQVLEFESGKPVRMTFDQAPIQGTAWEQGGHSILIASARRGTDALWRIRMDGLPAQRMIPSADPQRKPAVTEDGRSLAFEHWHITTRFSRYGTSADSEPTPFRRGVAMERGLSLSADGTRAVYLSNFGDKEAVYLASMPDGVPRPLTRGSYDAIETPRLSPDGKQVVFAASTQGHLDLYLVDSDGTRAEVRLSGEGESRAPTWSRDGKSIYFSSNRNGKRWQIFRQKLGQDSAEQITDGGGLAAQESSDGQWLYFVRPDRKGLWQRSTVAGGDDQFLAGELSPIDWRNMEVARDAVWFVGRPAGDATLYRYVFAKGRVETGPILVGLMPDSGLALLPSGKEVVVSEEADAQVDIDLATLQ